LASVIAAGASASSQPAPAAPAPPPARQQEAKPLHEVQVICRSQGLATIYRYAKTIEMGCGVSATRVAEDWYDIGVISGIGDYGAIHGDLTLLCLCKHLGGCAPELQRTTFDRVSKLAAALRSRETEGRAVLAATGGLPKGCIEPFPVGELVRAGFQCAVGAAPQSRTFAEQRIASIMRVAELGRVDAEVVARACSAAE
jgi:hypothetical protein